MLDTKSAQGGLQMQSMLRQHEHPSADWPCMGRVGARAAWCSQWRASTAVVVAWKPFIADAGIAIAAPAFAIIAHAINNATRRTNG